MQEGTHKADVSFCCFNGNVLAPRNCVAIAGSVCCIVACVHSFSFPLCPSVLPNIPPVLANSVQGTRDVPWRPGACNAPEPRQLLSLVHTGAGHYSTEQTCIGEPQMGPRRWSPWAPVHLPPPRTPSNKQSRQHKVRKQECRVVQGAQGPGCKTERVQGKRAAVCRMP